MSRALAVIGASAGLGRALAEAAAAAGHPLVLVASDPRDLEPLAADLALRFGVEVRTVAARLTTDSQALDELAATLRDHLGALAGPGGIGLLLPVGLSRDDDDGTLTGAEADKILAANLTGVTLLLSGLIEWLEEQPSARVVGFGSVTASRGRSKNVLYAACKRGLESFFESLRHRTSGTEVRVQLYRVGYMATQLTYGKKMEFPVAQPEDLARRVLADLDVDFGQRSYPGFWFWICWVLDWVPWVIYRKLKF